MLGLIILSDLQTNHMRNGTVLITYNNDRKQQYISLWQFQETVINHAVNKIFQINVCIYVYVGDQAKIL